MKLAYIIICIVSASFPPPVFPSFSMKLPTAHRSHIEEPSILRCRDMLRLLNRGVCVSGVSSCCDVLQLASNEQDSFKWTQTNKVSSGSIAAMNSNCCEIKFKVFISANPGTHILTFLFANHGTYIFVFHIVSLLTIIIVFHSVSILTIVILFANLNTPICAFVQPLYPAWMNESYLNEM